MPNADAPVDVKAIDAAIASVLQAEQEARAAVARCAALADRRVQTAREQSRAVAERAAARTARVHTWAATALATRVARIETERAALQAMAGDERIDPAQVRTAAERLAAELTGDGT